jgi:hypothetical protein
MIFVLSSGSWLPSIAARRKRVNRPTVAALGRRPPPFAGSWARLSAHDLPLTNFVRLLGAVSSQDRARPESSKA